MPAHLLSPFVPDRYSHSSETLERVRDRAPDKSAKEQPTKGARRRRNGRNSRLTTLRAMLGTRDAARHLGVSPATLRGWRKEGTGPDFIQYAPNGRCRYDVAELEKFKAQHRRVPAVRARLESFDVAV